MMQYWMVWTLTHMYIVIPHNKNGLNDACSTTSTLNLNQTCIRDSKEIKGINKNK